MASRIAFFLITVFWVVMNFLLWRSEFGGRNHVGTTVPLEVVWQKILTAPDNSRLEISHHGQKIGYCQWSANIGQELATGKISTDEIPPDGLAQKLTSYRIDLEGNLSITEGPNRLRFDIGARFGTNHLWQEFNARFNLRPDSWEIRSRAIDKTLTVHTENQDEKTDRTYKFSDFQNQQFLTRELQLPMYPQFFEALGVHSASGTAPISLGLTWEARNDWITIGHTSVRAYRLQARLFDRFSIIVIVSRVGEILRVELPDEWLFVNDQFSSM